MSSPNVDKAVELLTKSGYTKDKPLAIEFNWPLKLVFVPLCFYAVWLLAPEGSLPYIYFDF